MSIFGDGRVFLFALFRKQSISSNRESTAIVEFCVLGEFFPMCLFLTLFLCWKDWLEAESRIMAWNNHPVLSAWFPPDLPASKSLTFFFFTSTRDTHLHFFCLFSPLTFVHLSIWPNFSLFSLRSKRWYHQASGGGEGCLQIQLGKSPHG